MIVECVSEWALFVVFWGGGEKGGGCELVLEGVGRSFLVGW